MTMTTQTIERPVRRPSADLKALFPGRYLSVTSFKRDGTGVATPVWFVSDGSRLFALTELRSAKVRRVRRDPRVLVASCRADGKLRRKPVEARVEVLTTTADLERAQKLLIERYKLSYRVVMLFYRLARRLRGKQSVADGAVLAITVGGTAPDGHRRHAELLHPPIPIRQAPEPSLDDWSHTPPHGDPLLR
jgi:PPOX class probable F420-dependent enzyme